jgi:nitrile hydratase accessory protein
MNERADETDSPSLPDVDVDRTFTAPWQARIFGLAVALTDSEDLDWERFQSRLVDEIDGESGAGSDVATGSADARKAARAQEGAYYREWLAALERLLVEDGYLDPGDLTDRVDEFEGGDRTAHEFVDGDPRAHTEQLPEDHAEGGDHSHEHGHEHGHTQHDSDTQHDGRNQHDSDTQHDGRNQHDSDTQHDDHTQHDSDTQHEGNPQHEGHTQHEGQSDGDGHSHEDSG